MDHSVKAMNNSHRKMQLTRILNRHRFENDELEVLYQRYIFKLQHSSVASVVALFILLTGTGEESQKNEQSEKFSLFFFSEGLLANLSIAYAQAPTAQNVYHGLHCLLFALLLGFLNTRLMQDAYLLWVCYAILFFCATFCAVSLPHDSLATSLKVETKRVIAEGVWQVKNNFLCVCVCVCEFILQLELDVCLDIWQKFTASGGFLALQMGIRRVLLQ